MNFLLSGELWTDRVVVMISALILNALLGGPRAVIRRLGLQKPGLFILNGLRLLERKLNREKRSLPDRKRRGMVLAAAVVLLGVAVGVALVAAFRVLAYGMLLEIALLTVLLSLRQSADIANALALHLENEKSEAARAELSGTAWRNAPLLDAHGLARAGMETCAVQWADRVVSPLFWYALLGVPGVLALRLLSTLSDAMLHVRDSFGWAADQLSILAHYAPSLIASAFVVAASCFLPFASPLAAMRHWIMHCVDPWYRRRQVAVFGAALNVAGGGSSSVYAQGQWLGGPVAKALPRDARRSALLLWLSAFMLLMLLSAMLA